MCEPIGILGGTFDPVHLGHIDLALRAMERLPLSRVLLMPCATPPHKNPPDLTRPSHREAMVRLAVADHTGLEVSALELKRGGVNYTLDSLRRLRDGSPTTNPVFVMGMDSLIDLPTWHEFLQLIEEFHMLVFDRPRATLADAGSRLHPRVLTRLHELGQGRQELAPPGELHPARIHHVPQRLLDISSRRIRSRVRRGLPTDDLVPAAVAGYIRDNGLYQREDRH